jgi:nitric oxide reductase large subunit
MKKRLKVRQGDVLFLPIERIPAGKQTKRENGVVAYGEVTGHAHRLADLDTAEVLEIGDGLFVRVSETGVSIVGAAGATFTHEEHGPASLLPGNYQIRIQREYTPEAIRNVVD